jgi:hypothetical protein
MSGFDHMFSSPVFLDLLALLHLHNPIAHGKGCTKVTSCCCICHCLLPDQRIMRDIKVPTCYYRWSFTHSGERIRKQDFVDSLLDDTTFWHILIPYFSRHFNIIVSETIHVQVCMFKPQLNVTIFMIIQLINI